jgi:hypothetical protein
MFIIQLQRRTVSLHFYFEDESFGLLKNTVTCISITRQRVGKHIPAAHAHATIGRLLLGNGPVNTDP